MKRIPLAAFAALLLSPAVLADRFYLGSAEEAQKMAEGSSPNVLEGIVTGETDSTYTIRVVGGEVVIPKSMVYRIEKDGLTLDKIVEREKAMAGSAGRVAAQVAETPVEIVEVESEDCCYHASAHGHAHAAEAHHGVIGFDPVLHTAVIGYDLSAKIFELEQLYEQTKDRRYIKAVRKLRRLR